MAFSQAKLDEVKAAAAAAGPCMVEEIQEYSNWKAPEFFSCKSGVLLWGQLSTIMQGHLEEKLDTPNGPYLTIDCNNQSSILRHCFRYRAPARKGLWKVEAAFTGVPDRPIGYVCHHIEVDGPDLLRRAALVGKSLDNDHVDRDIVYVNRYDWSGHGCPGAGYQLMKGLIKNENEEEEEEDEYVFDPDEEWPRELTAKEQRFEDKKAYEDGLTMNRFMLVDEQGYPQLAQSLREGFKLDTKNYLFRDNRNLNNVESAAATLMSREAPSCSDAFGVNLGVGDKDNELGWMAFQNDELVGFVYDGVYCDLQGTLFEYGDIEVEVEREPEPEFNDEFDLDDWETKKRNIKAGGLILVCSNCTSYGGCLRRCDNCGRGGHVAKDCAGHGHLVRDCPNPPRKRDREVSDSPSPPKKRKKAKSKKVQLMDQICDHCLKFGHTRDTCFALHPCDHCHKTGHRRDRCFSLYPELRPQRHSDSNQQRRGGSYGEQQYGGYGRHWDDDLPSGLSFFPDSDDDAD